MASHETLKSTSHNIIKKYMMWLIPFCAGTTLRISIAIQVYMQIYKLQNWVWTCSKHKQVSYSHASENHEKWAGHAYKSHTHDVGVRRWLTLLLVSLDHGTSIHEQIHGFSGCVFAVSLWKGNQLSFSVPAIVVASASKLWHQQVLF